MHLKYTDNVDVHFSAESSASRDKSFPPVAMVTILQRRPSELLLEISEPNMSAKINLRYRICSVCKFHTHTHTRTHTDKHTLTY